MTSQKQQALNDDGNIWKAKPLPWHRALAPDALKQKERTLPSKKKIRQFALVCLEWYETSGRRFKWRREHMPLYEVIVAECLLQRTKAVTVEAFLSPFIKQFPTWRAIAGADRSDLEATLRPVGLQRRRSASMQAMAQAVLARGCKVPSDPQELLALPGVGQYLYYAVTLYRDDAALPLLDSSMARLLERCFGKRILADIRYDPYLQQLSRKIVEQGEPKRLNWAMLDLAAMVCKLTKPRCEICPLKPSCALFRSHKSAVNFKRSRIQ